LGLTLENNFDPISAALVAVRNKSKN
jgi:hypothetical protein